MNSNTSVTPSQQECEQLQMFVDEIYQSSPQIQNFASEPDIFN